MSNGKVPIEVCQLSFRGAKYDGQWYVYRGIGLGGEYYHLANDTWRKSISPEDFMDSEKEAEAVAEKARKAAKTGKSPAPPP